MVLGFKQKFPDGTPTDFQNKIWTGKKKHTIREDKKGRWKAGYSIQMAHGVRTKNYECFNNAEKCLSVQKIVISMFAGCVFIRVDGRELSSWEMDALIINDGLTRNQFFEWFLPDGDGYFEGVIIHWTYLKY